MTLRLVCPAVRKARAVGIGGTLALAGSLAMGCPAHAATVTINTATTSPLATSTVDGGTPGDIEIIQGGSITLSSGTALTIDSDNSIANSGQVSIADSNNSIGVSIAPGTTGNFTNSGSITLGDAITGVTHPNYANNKRGLILNSGGSFTGTLDFASGSSLTVRGDNSVGVDLQGSLIGNFTNAGTMVNVGDDSVGVRVAAPVTGAVTNQGTLSMQGINSSALEILAPVSGRVENDGLIQATGYDKLTPSTSTGTDNYNATQATQQSHETVGIGASLQGGFFNNAVVGGTTATITSAGSADALLISPSVSGGAAGNIQISEAGTGADAYGVINLGTIAAQGIYDGVSAEAVRIEGTTSPGPYTTTLLGGLDNIGTISAKASEASATAVAIGTNASVPTIINYGSITATSNSSTSSQALGLSIEAGANVPSLNNEGTIGALLTGPTGSATALRDLSGTLTTISNTGVIAGHVVPKSGETQASGSAVAIDLSATSNDITITNNLPAGYDPTAGTVAGEIVGATKLGSGSDTFNMVNGAVIGAIDFGAGNDALNVSHGSITGDLAFGAGADVVHMTGGKFVGGVSDSDGQLTLKVSGGSFVITSSSALNITSARVGSEGTFGVSVNAAGTSATHVIASGTATFDPGSTITARFLGTMPLQFDAPIVTASTLNVGADPNSLLGLALPYVYTGSLSTQASGADESLVLHLTRKSAADLGVRPNLAPALGPFLSALGNDSKVADAVLGVSSNAAFNSAFIQFMPSFTDASLQVAKLATQGYDTSISSRIEKLFIDQVGAGAWTDERAYTLNRDTTASARGYNAQGVLLSLGLDDYLTDNVVLGVMLGYDGESYQEDLDSDTPVSTHHWTGGVYSGGHLGRLLFSGSALIGYGTSSVTRNLVLGNVTRASSADWSGWRYSADASLGYSASFARFYVRPNAGITYLHNGRGAYTEKGGANPTTGGNAFALEYASRGTNALNTHADIAIGTNILQDYTEIGYGPVMKYTISPELRLGWSYDLIKTPVKTRVRFVSSTDWFTVESDSRQRQLLHAGLGFHVNTSYGSFGAGVQAMYGKHSSTYAASLHAAFAF